MTKCGQKNFQKNKNPPINLYINKIREIKQILTDFLNIIHIPKSAQLQIYANTN